MITSKLANQSSRFLLVVVAMGFLFSMLFTLTHQQISHAASGACSAPATDYGTVTATVNVTGAGNYYIWTRMAAADSSDTSYLLQIDTSNCFTVGSSAAKAVPTYASGATTHFTNDSSNWIDTDTSSNRIQVSLSAGSHTIELIGNAPGVVLDRLVFTQDSSCTPSGTGDNCAPPPDTQKPTAAVTSPTSGQTVSGTINVTATASDNVGVTKVEFYRDPVNGVGTLFGTDTTGSNGTYSAPLDTTTLSNGSHSVAVEAYDAAGNLQGTAWISFTVSNSTDSTGPSISIANLTSGAILNTDSTGSPYTSSSYTVTANASDASGIKNVVFKVDGATAATDTSSPYSFAIDLTKLSCGSHTITATATDNSANQNTNTASVSFKATYAEDIDDDCHVDYLDLSALASKYNTTGSGLGRADINGDKSVNYLDLSALSSQYNKH